MPWVRAYVQKTITKSGGGDFVRVFDFEVEDGDYELSNQGPNGDTGVVQLKAGGRKKLKLKKGEEANDFAVLAFPEQADV